MAEVQGDEDDCSLFECELHVTDVDLRRRPTFDAGGRRSGMVAAEL